jgi:hypothetical protein
LIPLAEFGFLTISEGKRFLSDCFGLQDDKEKAQAIISKKESRGKNIIFIDQRIKNPV